MSEVVEVMARAIDPDKFTFWQSSYDYEMGQSGDAAEATKFADWCHGIGTVRQQAHAALAALDAAGFVLVPKEPTTAAREVALATATKFNPGRSEDHIKAVAFDAVSIYRAMLAASQVTS